MLYLLIAVAPVLCTTLIGRIMHRPLVAAGIVSALALAYVVGVAVIAAHGGAGVSVGLLVLLPAWAIATSFTEAIRLRRSAQDRAT